MHDGYWHDGMGNGNWSWIVMAILMVAFWGGLVWIGVTLVKRNHHAPSFQGPMASAAPAPRPSAEEVLADRLARGDIDPDDYRQRLAALRTPTGS